MMTDDNSERASRRKFVAAVGTAGIIGVAGCSGGGNNEAGAEGGTDSGESTTASDTTASDTTASDTTTEGSEETDQAELGPGSDGPLTADGSSTVYPIASDAASVWNSNPPADDEEYWGPGQYDIDTDLPMAEYWGGLYGFESPNEGQPPFYTNVGLSHSGTGVTKVMNGQVDIGNSSAPVEDELPERESYENFVDHVLGVDGQPIVVSRAIYDAGVTSLTGQQLSQIYTGEISNWSEVGGPDREIQALGRAEGSGTDTAFRANLLGSPDAEMPGVDGRYGQNQQLQTAIANSDNAIGYIALAFVQPDGPTPPISLEIEGTTYTYGENLGDQGYPLSRDLHSYTWEDTSAKEAAFIRMVVSDYGQENYVQPNNYFTLSDSRQEEELGKLPEPSN